MHEKIITLNKKAKAESTENVSCVGLIFRNKTFLRKK